MNLLEETKSVLARHNRQVSYIDWAVIGVDEHVICDNSVAISLPPFHWSKDLYAFLEKLDFDYDDGFGGQNVYGKIMLNDGSWLERAEYDGSEWWEFKERVSFTVAMEELKEQLEL